MDLTKEALVVRSEDLLVLSGIPPILVTGALLLMLIVYLLDSFTILTVIFYESNVFMLLTFAALWTLLR